VGGLGANWLADDELLCGLLLLPKVQPHPRKYTPQRVFLGVASSSRAHRPALDQTQLSPRFRGILALTVHDLIMCMRWCRVLQPSRIKILECLESYAREGIARWRTPSSVSIASSHLAVRTLVSARGYRICSRFTVLHLPFRHVLEAPDVGPQPSLMLLPRIMIFGGYASFIFCLQAAIVSAVAQI
jgi:hypothetical protein